MMAQIISQLNGKLSIKTGLSQLSFVDNPDSEISELKKENAADITGAALMADAASKVTPAGESGDAI